MQFKEQNCKQNELLMKKLNFLLTMLLVAMVSLSFVSCEKEQPEEKKKEKTYSELIVGTWDMVSLELYVKEGGQEASQKVPVTDYGFTAVFDKNGEFVMDLGELLVGEYKIEGKKLLVYGEPVMEIAKLTEQDLALVQEFTEDDYMERYTYNFVRAAE